MSVEGSHPLETVAADGTGWQYKGKEEEQRTFGPRARTTHLNTGSSWRNLG